jgi:hypothetical protein
MEEMIKLYSREKSPVQKPAFSREGHEIASPLIP